MNLFYIIRCVGKASSIARRTIAPRLVRVQEILIHRREIFESKNDRMIPAASVLKGFVNKGYLYLYIINTVLLGIYVDIEYM